MNGLLGGLKLTGLSLSKYSATTGRPVSSGIPQGLILKPILFSVLNNSPDGFSSLARSEMRLSCGEQLVN